MARILVTEQLADAGLEQLRSAGHQIDVQLGLSPDALLEAVRGAEALIIRSATKVTADVLEAGSDLVVVGRAGVGVDNVDVEAATRRGVMVVNAPGSNVLSTAEHAMALLLSLARNVPQASAALRSGRWEKARWEGIELHGKTLGVLGLGRIGTLVAQRAHSFGMRLIAWDPWMAADRARQLGVELVELEDLFAQADFVSIHLLKTKESQGLIGKDLLAKAKPGLRLVNAARGGIVDEDALAAAIRDGRIGGAAIDVFATEPTTESPLFDLDNVVVTPHLAASTPEAQDKAGQVIAEQVALALAGDFVPFAVNIEATEAPEAVRPFLPLAERLGRLFTSLMGSLPGTLDIEYQGDLAGNDTRLLKLAVLKGVLGPTADAPVSYVNAPALAEERGMVVREATTTTPAEYVNLLSLRGGDRSIAGTITGSRGEARIVMVDDHAVDVPFADCMLFVRNDDRIGVIANVTTTLAGAQVNIANMALGRSRSAPTAVMVLALDGPLDPGVTASLLTLPGILDARFVEQV